VAGFDRACADRALIDIDHPVDLLQAFDRSHGDASNTLPFNFDAA